MKKAILAVVNVLCGRAGDPGHVSNGVKLARSR
jgi:hypothetical protein